MLTELLLWVRVEPSVGGGRLDVAGATDVISCGYQNVFADCDESGSCDRVTTPLLCMKRRCRGGGAEV